MGSNMTQYFLYSADLKTRIMWRMPKLATYLYCTAWDHLSLSFSSLWVPRWLTMGKWIPGRQFPTWPGKTEFQGSFHINVSEGARQLWFTPVILAT
jgi:hypothetical protein